MVVPAAPPPRGRRIDGGPGSLLPCPPRRTPLLQGTAHAHLALAGRSRAEIPDSIPPEELALVSFLRGGKPRCIKGGKLHGPVHRADPVAQSLSSAPAGGPGRLMDADALTLLPTGPGRSLQEENGANRSRVSACLAGHGRRGG